MKCDLHVHTVYSGACNVPILKRVCKESYNDPDALYTKLRRSGMSLVTVTDHDSIGSVDVLGKHHDFFLSEEVTCLMPTGTKFHLAVYDINERQHFELQERRKDFWALLAYLREQGLLFAINHPFSSLTGRRSLYDYMLYRDHFPAAEILNGHMLEQANQLGREFARESRMIGLAGSDAHAIVSVGSAWTEVPGARNKQEFFAGIRAGQARVGGTSGGYGRLTREVLSIGMSMVSEQPWLFPLLFMGAFVGPMITLGNYWREHSFARRWSSLVQQGQLGQNRVAENAPKEDFVEVAQS